MMLKLPSLFVLFIALALPIFAQGPKPLPEHAMLKMDDGEWDAHLSLYAADPTEEPRKYLFKETNHMVGELWSIGKLEGKIGDSPFVGWATLGYDPTKGKYVGTWVDSTTPELTQMEGSYAHETKTLILYYTTRNPDGSEVKRKNVMVYKDADTRDFMGYVMKDGTWVKSMGILYKRTK